MNCRKIRTWPDRVPIKLGVMFKLNAVQIRIQKQIQFFDNFCHLQEKGEAWLIPELTFPWKKSGHFRKMEGHGVFIVWFSALRRLPAE
jgi:hypothetical protein